jgi:hypothetical protein
MARPLLATDHLDGDFGDNFSQLGGNRFQKKPSGLGVPKLRADETD